MVNGGELFKSFRLYLSEFPKKGNTFSNSRCFSLDIRANLDHTGDLFMDSLRYFKYYASINEINHKLFDMEKLMKFAFFNVYFS